MIISVLEEVSGTLMAGNEDSAHIYIVLPRKRCKVSYVMQCLSQKAVRVSPKPSKIPHKDTTMYPYGSKLKIKWSILLGAPIF